MTGARRLLAALPAPDAALEAEVSALERALEEERERAARLERDADLTVDPVARRRFFIAVALMPLVLFATAAMALRADTVFTPALSIRFILLADALSLAAITLFWSRLKRTRVNQRDEA